MSRATNRLARESSPYLRQHMHNPVDWYPWGEEAFARARAEDRPILLSVGYSACHWCHVMERESFENPATAEVMNRLFVNVKVDREERPDVDNLYQTAVQLMRRSGGWPLTAFLTPDGRPFFAGTYFPDEPRYGMPAFRDLLAQVDRAWRERRGDVEQSADGVREAIGRAQAVDGGGGLPDAEVVADAARFLLGRVDPEHGGFGEAPKFPSPSNLWTLWRHAVRAGDAAAGDAVRLTLRRMADGGMYDQLGGGFHRYATDREWLVPHFEKMLYDNAQLVSLYLEGWRAARTTEEAADCLRVATETLDYLQRDLTAPDGLLYSATDADSEGEEGRYFVWSPEAVRAVVGDGLDAEAFCRRYDVTAAGNWEGRSILRRRQPLAEVARALGIDEAACADRVARAAARLLEARYARVAPLRDEKCLVAWNGLAIVAFCDGWRAVGRADWRDAAVRCGSTVLERLVREGRLLHSACGDDVRGPGFLDDHAAFGLACVHLHEVTGARRWLDAALALAMLLDAWFADREGGGWFQTPEDGEALVLRPRDTHDSAVPSGSGLAAAFLLRLHAHVPEPRWLARVEATLAAHQQQLERNPFGSGCLLGVADAWLAGFEEVVLTGEGPERAAMERVCHAVPGTYDRLVLDLAALPPEHPAAGGRAATGPTAWLCRGRSCSLPVTDAAGLERLLRAR